MREAEYLRQQADDCRSAAMVSDGHARRGLMQLANYYWKEAQKLDAGTLRVLKH
jgi:hypothetical protein